MGLREVKATRTRDALVESALGLFERSSFEATTMEQIADHAGVGVATLYRYFPTKDSLLLEPIASRLGGLAAQLDCRPAAESIDQALGLAVRAFLEESDVHREQIRRLRSQLDRAAGPRARLWDLWAQERARLEEAVRRRIGAQRAELEAVVAAHLAMVVVEIALDVARTPAGDNAAAIADEVIGLLGSGRAIVPRLPQVVPAGVTDV